jgi:hypothetical protein
MRPPIERLPFNVYRTVKHLTQLQLCITRICTLAVVNSIPDGVLYPGRTSTDRMGFVPKGPPRFPQHYDGCSVFCETTPQLSEIIGSNGEQVEMNCVHDETYVNSSEEEIQRMQHV